LQPAEGPHEHADTRGWGTCPACETAWPQLFDAEYCECRTQVLWFWRRRRGGEAMLETVCFNTEGEFVRRDVPTRDTIGTDS
jgi:hypothetical protein